MTEYYPLDSLITQLERHEGLSLVAYKCSAGHWTIGYGHNLDANPIPGIDKNSSINKDQADRLLRTYAAAIGSALLERFPWMWDMPSTRFCVFVNMAFNMGVNGLAKFRNALYAAEDRDYIKAAEEMKDSSWYHQVGGYSATSEEGKRNGRAGRSYELVEQMRTGKWQA